MDKFYELARDRFVIKELIPVTIDEKNKNIIYESEVILEKNGNQVYAELQSSIYRNEIHSLTGREVEGFLEFSIGNIEKTKSGLLETNIIRKPVLKNILNGVIKEEEHFSRNSNNKIFEGFHFILDCGILIFFSALKEKNIRKGDSIKLEGSLILRKYKFLKDVVRK